MARAVRRTATTAVTGAVAAPAGRAVRLCGLAAIACLTAVPVSSVSIAQNIDGTGLPKTALEERIRELGVRNRVVSGEEDFRKRAQAIIQSDPNTDALADMRNGIVGLMMNGQRAFGRLVAPGVSCGAEADGSVRYLTRDLSSFIIRFRDNLGVFEGTAFVLFKNYATTYNLIVLRHDPDGIGAMCRPRQASDRG